MRASCLFPCAERTLQALLRVSDGARKRPGSGANRQARLIQLLPRRSPVHRQLLAQRPWVISHFSERLFYSLGLHFRSAARLLDALSKLFVREDLPVHHSPRANAEIIHVCQPLLAEPS